MTRPKLLGFWLLMLAVAFLVQLGCWQTAEWIHAQGMRKSVQDAASHYALSLRERLDALETQMLLDVAPLDAAGLRKPQVLERALEIFPEIRRVEVRDESANLLQTVGGAASAPSRQSLSPGLLAVFSHALTVRNVVYSSVYYERPTEPAGSPVAMTEPRLDVLIPRRSGQNEMLVVTVDPRLWFSDALNESFSLTDKNIQYQLLDGSQTVVVENAQADTPTSYAVMEVASLNLAGLQLSIRAIRAVASEPGFQSLRVLISLLGGLLALLTALLIRSSVLRRSATARIQKLQAKAEMDARAVTLGEMSTAIAHELNQPLGAIENFAHGCERLLQRPQIPVQDLVSGLQQIRSEAQRGSKVIASIREFVKRENQTIEVVDVDQAIESLRPLLEIQAKKLHAKLNVQCPQGLQIQTNRALFEQVILNLARNGLEAMQETPASERALTIRSALTTHHNARQVTIWVEDNGCGVEESLRHKLFSPFFTTKASGMGIGLSLCQSIVERHGGTIRWQPGKPTGSCFELSLPIIAGGA